MGYLVKAVVGLGLYFGGVALFNVQLIDLLEVGTCASGNVPYEISRPCPEGVGSSILLLNASIFAGIIGAVVFGFRGEAPWASGRKRGFRGLFGFGAFAWGFFFAATGASVLLATINNEAIGPDGDLGGRIVAGTFLLMGIPALIGVLASWIGGLRSGSGESARAPGSAPGSSAGIAPAGGVMEQMRAGLERAAGETVGRLPGSGALSPGGGVDTLGDLERLNRLRESGALTEAEFEREKAKVLSRQ